MIEVKNLVKKYKNETAVDGISFRVRKGEIFGLLGPNGAGKTTTINMLTGIAIPTSGTAKIAGYDIIQNPIEVKQRIGIASQDSNFDHHLNLRENLFYNGLLYGIPRKKLKQRVQWALEWSRLDDHWKKKPPQLSGGMLRRLLVARAMINDPEILFLDEPTTGLDPQSRILLWHHILNLKESGKTVLLTTHQMEEAEILCDRISIIDAGKIIANGTPLELKKILNKKTVVNINLLKPDVSGALAKKVRSIQGVNYLASEDGLFRVHVDSDLVIEEVLKYIIRNNGIKGIDVIRPTLEEVFIHLTGRELRE
ncbi:MAG: ATP-binding cassette domain-containing protein [Methanosarcinales archaeon]